MKSLVTAAIAATLFAASFNACAATFDYNAFADANPGAYAGCMSNACSTIDGYLADGASFKRAELRGASILAACVKNVAQ